MLWLGQRSEMSLEARAALGVGYPLHQSLDPSADLLCQLDDDPPGPRTWQSR
jgi:hypothetical protein